jgi:hypothetical protein
MFHNMTQSASFPTNINTMMEGLPKEDDFPEFQRGLEVFNNNELPPSLRSSCLALVAEQEIRSNPPTSAALPSPNKKRLLEQVSYIHGLHAISTSQKQSTAGQLTQAYFESKHKLESSFYLLNGKLEPTPLLSSSPNHLLQNLHPITYYVYLALKYIQGFLIILTPAVRPVQFG